MVKTWPGDHAGDVARHQLGLLLYEEKKLPEAIEMLASIRPTYASAISARYQLAQAALQATDKDPPAATDKHKRTWKERAFAALKDMPPLPKEADPGTTQLYIRGKLQLGSLLYEAKKFDQLENLAKPLVEGLDNGSFRLTPEAKQDLYPTVQSLEL